MTTLATQPDQQAQTFEARGAVAQLFRCRDDEVLVEGPAGTGKSRGVLEYINWAMESWPGIRVLLARKTRASMSQSVLVTWENHVHADGHESIGSVQRTGRSSYTYRNGSELVVAGLDDPERVKSTEYDFVYCFVGDTKVECPSKIIKAYKRKYSGPLVRIRTASGNELTGTPNHPILTNNGWVALGLLKEGDNVISRVRRENVSLGADPDVGDKPATIANVFRSFSLSGSTLAQRVKGVPVNFHGDGAGGDVDVVSANGGFHVSSKAPILEPSVEFRGERGDLEQPTLVRSGPSRKVCFGVRAPEVRGDRQLGVFPKLCSPLVGSGSLLCCCPAGCSEFPGPLAVSVPSVPVAGGAGLGLGGDASLLEDSLEDRITNAKPSGGGDQPPFPFEVSLDRVVNCGRVEGDFGGHVYNLETEENYYVAGDIIVHNCNEATEITLNDWEMVVGRLRNGKMPYQQAIADCNPDTPTHWLNKRAQSGAMVRLYSRHADNPRYFTRDGRRTPAGAAYLAKLDRLTGVRGLRLREGKWAAAEGVVYADFDPAIHVVDPYPVPADWRRVRGVDFGYTNPFAGQWWAIDPDGRLVMYREVYGTRRLVEDWAKDIHRISRGDRFEATTADHDAEDRATLERHGITTIPAHKAITPGIEAVQSRLRVEDDGRPRLTIMRDVLDRRDPALVEAGKPTCLVEEIPGYTYPPGRDGRPVKESPAKVDDHACDVLRYVVAYADGLGSKEVYIGGSMVEDEPTRAEPDWFGDDEDDDAWA